MTQLAGKQIQSGTINKLQTSVQIVAADGSRPLTADWDVGGFKIRNAADPVSTQDLVTLGYLQGYAAGVRDPKDTVRLATAGALPAYTAAGAGVGKTLTANANGALSVDSVAVATGNRVGNVNAGVDAGLYTVTAPGSAGTPFVLTRATDADQASEFTQGLYFEVAEGTSNAGFGYLLTTADPITLDTTSLTFVQIKAGISFATPSTNVKSDGVSATAGSATSAVRSDAGLVALTGAPINVGTANSAGAAGAGELARAAHVHAVPVAVATDLQFTASVTASDGDAATASTVSKPNALSGAFEIRVNGLAVAVGNGTKTGADAYVSGDGGTTARAFSAIAAADTIRWQGSVAGYQLAATDKIDLVYSAF